MRFRADQFFVSYTQKGVFLDDQLRKALALSEGDVIEMKLSIEDKFNRVVYTIIRAKENWDSEMEKSAYGKYWFSEAAASRILTDKSLVIIGYVDWNNLVYDWDSKSLIRVNPAIEIEKHDKVRPCSKLMLKITSAPPMKISDNEPALDMSEVVREKSETILWFQTDETKKKPVNMRRTGLETLHLLGVERKNILKNNGINTILQLISCPVEKLRKIRGISYHLLEKWIMSSSKALVPSAYPINCQVFLTKPRRQKLEVTDRTEIKVLAPYYSQFFVRGHPRVGSGILEALDCALGPFYNINMKRMDAVTLTGKDGGREVNLFGPWVVEMFGFDKKDEVEELLETLEGCIENAFQIGRERDVILLISPQETYIEADQILNALVNKLAVQYLSPKQMLQRLRWGERIIVDSNVLVDGRLSSLIMRAMMDTLDYPQKKLEIVIPNIVTYEVKSMVDRPSKKVIQYRLANLELQRLRALGDAGYIGIEYSGEIPQVPPITEQEKGTWKFYSSLRDEYILKIMEEVDDATLVTQDGRLATSAYVKGLEVIHLKPLIKALKEDYTQEISSFSSIPRNEQDTILSEIADDLLVSKSTLREIIKSI